MQVGSPLEMSFEIKGRGKCNMRFKRLLPSSEGVVVRYDLPFGLNVENQDGVAVCTKDGEGGEKVGDILRFTLQWKGQQPGMFDVCSCMERRLQNSFDEVIAALVSNDGTYAEEIVLIFERPLEGANVNSLQGEVV